MASSTTAVTPSNPVTAPDKHHGRPPWLTCRRRTYARRLHQSCSSRVGYLRKHAIRAGFWPALSPLLPFICLSRTESPLHSPGQQQCVCDRPSFSRSSMAAVHTKYGAVEVSHDLPAAAEAAPRDDHHGDFVTRNEEQDLSRGLHQRHISLIALAGAIVCVIIEDGL